MKALKMIRAGALISLIGFFCSGPMAVSIVLITHPQPDWLTVSQYITYYHPIQSLPYYLGFLILAGMLLLAVGHLSYDFTSTKQIRPSMVISLALTIVFLGLIAFNYVCQISFIPNLVEDFRPEYESLIAGLSMANPESFCWANEMWGYCFLGWATWAGATFYQNKSNFIKWLMIGNGLISMISPIWTILEPGWVLTSTGMGLYLFWNIWMIMLMLAIFLKSRKWNA
jgi:hypothetical protein